MREDQPYYSFSREERNLVAILYHLLLSDAQNLRRFLSEVGHVPARAVDECELYFEFAMLRDLWDQMDVASHRRFIVDLLPPVLQDEPSLQNEPDEWNAFFGVRKDPTARPATDYASPAAWQPAKLPVRIRADDFRAVSLLRWCFNIKPDLVVVTGTGQALCVEAKLGYGLSHYPSKGPAKTEWSNRGCQGTVSQLECQRYLFQHVLSNHFTTVSYALITRQTPRSARRESIAHCTWKAILTAMDTSHSSPFVRKWIDQNGPLNRQRTAKAIATVQE